MTADYLLTLAAHLDREPLCTCVETDRGTDTLGCEIHDAAGAQLDAAPPVVCDGTSAPPECCRDAGEGD